jgi:hypothetical protein
VDQYLLDEAKKYGFLSGTEHHRLQHVYEMRSVYGHPYEEQPPVEDLVAGAAAVVDLVLSKPTKLRHGYLTEQVRLLTEDRRFLDDVPEATERYAAEVYSKAETCLCPWFLRRLWAKLSTMIADPASALFVRRGTWFSRAYLRQDGNIGSPSWDVISDLTQFPTVLSDTLAVPDLFPLVSMHAQDIVIGNLLSAGTVEGTHLRLLEALQVAGVLNTRQENRFISELTQMPLDHLASSGVSPVHYANHIVEKLKLHN